MSIKHKKYFEKKFLKKVTRVLQGPKFLNVHGLFPLPQGDHNF